MMNYQSQIFSSTALFLNLPLPKAGVLLYLLVIKWNKMPLEDFTYIISLGTYFSVRPH